jgi:hypothetical protein
LVSRPDQSFQPRYVVTIIHSQWVDIIRFEEGDVSAWVIHVLGRHVADGFKVRIRDGAILDRALCPCSIHVLNLGILAPKDAPNKRFGVQIPKKRTQQHRTWYWNFAIFCHAIFCH